MVFFCLFSIDATAESEKLGRLVNHSCISPNCKPQCVDINGQLHPILVALRDIAAGEELLYDYKDTNKEAVKANPWLSL